MDNLVLYKFVKLLKSNYLFFFLEMASCSREQETEFQLSWHPPPRHPQQAKISFNLIIYSSYSNGNFHLIYLISMDPFQIHNFICLFFMSDLICF